MKKQKIYSAILAAILTIGINELVFSKWFPNVSNVTISSLFAGPTPTEKVTKKVQVALLLDTSDSMDGLIEQAKSQLWQILNTLAKTEHEQYESTLEIALYEYGNPSRATRENQIRQLSGFTTDMDLISEILFSLKTDGGDEYCGAVIETSIQNLEWGQNDNDLKMIYIAGNEPFTQGPVNYAEACRLAKKENIFVNTIYCGNAQEGIQTMWKQGADLADGVYMNIDHNQTTTYIETPFDDKINDLNEKLNDTYIPYNHKGKSKKEAQKAQDNNAYSYSKANAADRAAFKSSKGYTNKWDIVDAYKKDKKVLEKTEMKALPDTMQNLSIEDLEREIEEIAAKRESIQKEILENTQKRNEFIEKNSKVEGDVQNLNSSIKRTIEKQAKQKGYKLNN